MNRITLDDVRDVLPDLDELRPVVDHMIARSKPDGVRTWSAAGRLDTVGSRMVEGSVVEEDVTRITRAEADHLAKLYGAIARAVRAVADGEAEDAAAALLEAALLEEARERPARAAAYAEAAHRAVRERRNSAVTALALRRWARAERALGHLETARDRYAAAHEAARALGDGRGAAEAAVGAGNALEEQGRWAEARAWYEAALEALSVVDRPAPERWHALLCVHIVARSQGDTEGSREWLARAEEAAEASGLDAAVPFIENARGQLRMAEGDFSAAERHLERGLSTAGDARSRVTIRLNLAEALFAQGRQLDAAEHAREAEREAIVAGLVKKLPETYRLLGRIASEDGDPDAFVLFERALEIVRERGLPILEEALTLQAYSMCERRNGSAETADTLLEAAQERFDQLGITHLRHTWADVFGPSTDNERLPDSGATHDE